MGTPRDDLAAARTRLRATGRERRRGLTEEQRAAATRRVVARLRALPALAGARRVLLTRAVGDELDLLALEHALRAAGTTVALPVVDGGDLRVVDLDDDTTMTAGWRGIAEPVGPASDGPVDAVVVPALALDRHGNRLGYGGGHFDRFLAGRAAGAVAVGAVFAAQLVDEVPVEPHDVRLDLVVTEAGTWRDGRRID